MEVVNIKHIAPDESVVQQLEEMLVEAKAGRLRGFLMAASMIEKRVVWIDAGSYDWFAMIGIMTRHIYMVNKDMDKQTTDWSPESEEKE